MHGEFDRCDDEVMNALAKVMVSAITPFGDLNQTKGLEAPPALVSVHWSTPEEEEILMNQTQIMLDRVKGYRPS